MFDTLPLISRVLWICVTALECLLAITVLRGGAWKRYPAMTVYVAWQAGGGFAALLISRFGSQMFFFLCLLCGKHPRERHRVCDCSRAVLQSF